MYAVCTVHCHKSVTIDRITGKQPAPNPPSTHHNLNLTRPTCDDPVQTASQAPQLAIYGKLEQVFLIKTYSDGEVQWLRTFGGNDDDWAYSVDQASDLGYAVVGGTYSFGSGDDDVYLLRVSSTGDSLWATTYGGSDNDQAYSINVTGDGGYIISGRTSSFGLGDQEVYLIKTDPVGMVGISDNNPPSMELPRSWALSQNYPNPFNPSTTVAFEIPGQKQHVSLVIYDIRGRRVKTLVDSELRPGKHKIHWNGRNGRGELVSSGIYLYTLKTGEGTFTRKMTVLK